MDEILVYFDETIPGPDENDWAVRACARQLDDGRWSGWLEFSADGADWRPTGSETIQPNRPDVEYWVGGLTRVYLEGALVRALDDASPDAAPMDRHAGAPPARHRESPRASAGPSRVPRTILDPFNVYAQGEGILRAELRALSDDQLRNIAAAFNVASPETASTLDEHQLVERIVVAARTHASRASNPELSA